MLYEPVADAGSADHHAGKHSLALVVKCPGQVEKDRQETGERDLHGTSLNEPVTICDPILHKLMSGTDRYLVVVILC